MSTVLTRKGADYSLNARTFVPPVSSGLVGWWYLGAMAGDDAPTGQARTIKNLAATTHAMTIVGTPTIATGYVQVDGSNYLNTTLPETLDFSFLILGLPMAVSGVAAGWIGSGTDKTMFDSSSTLTTLTAFTQRDSGGGAHGQVSGGALTLGAGYTAMRVLSYKITAATGVTGFRDLTTNVQGGVTISGGARLLANGSPTFRVGGSTQFPGAWRSGFVAVYNRVITDAEGDSIRQFVAKWRLAKFGDVV